MLKEKTHPKLENLRNFETGLGSSQGLYVFSVYLFSDELKILDFTQVKTFRRGGMRQPHLLHIHRFCFQVYYLFLFECLLALHHLLNIVILKGRVRNLLSTKPFHNTENSGQNLLALEG